MEPRLDFIQAAPDAFQAMQALQTTAENSGLEHSLLELIKLRVSQINRSAHCINLHFREAKTKGETDERLSLLDAWQEAPVYTDRERAALAWTEAVTRVTEGHVPDEVYTQLRQHFTEAESVHLTLAIVSVNGWNRFAVGFRKAPAVSQAAGPAQPVAT